jgi:hypothetical protein
MATRGGRQRIAKMLERVVCGALAVRRLGDDARDPLQYGTLRDKTVIVIPHENMNWFPFPDLPHGEKTDRARIMDNRHECAWSPEGARFNRKRTLDRILRALGLYDTRADSAEARFQDWRGLELVCWQSRRCA